jgi:hypothetical protein
MRPSMRDIIRARVEALDDWDDGGNFVLARDSGAHIISNTGPQGWNAGAGHVPPSIVPVLLRVFEGIRGELEIAPVSSNKSLEAALRKAERAFLDGPSFDQLVQYPPVSG